ncbi:MAG: hypothetical protein H6713_40660 [Myxococcales bacterium]|nr:hypothetical protein [Myxococcales bacterium]
MSVSTTTHQGRPYWIISVRRHGMRRRRYLDRRQHRKRDALALERALLAELDAAQGGAASATTTEDNETPTPTFAEFAARFLELEDARRPDFHNKKRDLELHLLPFFGETRLDALRLVDIDRLRAKLRRPSGPRASSRRSKRRQDAPLTSRRKGGAKSPKTINNILGTLRAVLNRACDYGVIDRVPRIKNESEARRDPEFLDFDEARALLAALPSDWRSLAHFAIRTGLRRGELMEWASPEIVDSLVTTLVRAGGPRSSGPRTRPA